MATEGSPRVGRTYHESDSWFETSPRPRPGSPNVIYIILDDVGYADLGCFGSEIRTPNFDRLANTGLRYSNFHTTTMCSPTRASLLTGRNHHSVGMRCLANFDFGYRNGRGSISHRAATVAEMLGTAGYANFAVGKWHVAPTDDISAAGPFDQWPLGRGFQRFYGFMNGSTDQYYPELVEDNHAVEQPRSPEQGYHLTADLVDKAISMLGTHVSLAPDRPFFLNLAFSAGHFPHQVPQAYMDRYEGVWDAGWDVIRRQRLERQKAMGLVPGSTELPPDSPGVENWNDLDADQRRVAIRLQQAYAGFLEYTDEQLGRLLDYLEATGTLDNTLIVVISDNGASIDCGPEGTTNVLRRFNQIPESFERNLAEIDQIGGPRSFSNYPWGWAQASNTPLRLFKSFTHGGGVRDPMIVSWPKGISDKGGIRHQFHHVVDITPTVLEICGIEAPETFRGVSQMPVHGTSFAYTFGAADAEPRKEVQYFEMFGHRGIWHKGWKAVTKHRRGEDFEIDDWELYKLDEDFNETRNLASEHPAKLREMTERWWAEAGRYDVMPLDDREVRFRAKAKPDSIRARSRYVFYPQLESIPSSAAPLTQDTSHRIIAELEIDDRSEGTIVSYGNSGGGYVLYLRDRRLNYVYNYCGETTRLVSDPLIGVGSVSLGFEYNKTGILTGIGSLVVNGQSSGEAKPHKTLLRISLAPMFIGRGGMPPVCDTISDEFRFSGLIKRVIFELGDDREMIPPNGDID
jgi:arylsulfatase A-like enzyme